MRTERTRNELISDVVIGCIAGAVVGFVLLLVAMGIAGIEGKGSASEPVDFRLIRDVFPVVFALAGAFAGLIRPWLATWWGRAYQVFIITLGLYGSVSVGMNKAFTGNVLLDGVVIAAVATPLWLLVMLTPFGRTFAADLDSMADRDNDAFEEQLKAQKKRKRRTDAPTEKNLLTTGWTVAGSVFLVWALSDLFFGIVEPWNAPYGYFILSSFGLGVFFGYRRWPLWLSAAGAIGGQALALLILPAVDRAWLGQGMMWAGISSLAVVAGTGLASWISHRPEEAPESSSRK